MDISDKLDLAQKTALRAAENSRYGCYMIFSKVAMLAATSASVTS